MNNYYDPSIFAVLGGFIFVLAILLIIMYVLTALGMQAMAKKLNIENSWLAWIPIANTYLMGKIAGDQVTIFKKDITKLSIVLLVGAIIICVISAIPVIGSLAGIAYAVIYFVALYKVYRIFAESNAVLYCVLSIIINVTAPFFIYFASKNEPNLDIFYGGTRGGYREAPAATQSVIPTPVPDPIQSETKAEEKIDE